MIPYPTSGLSESASYKHVRPEEILSVPSSSGAAEDITVFGPARRLRSHRYEVIGPNGVWVKLIQPPRSGLVTIHWTTRLKRTA